MAAYCFYCGDIKAIVKSQVARKVALLEREETKMVTGKTAAWVQLHHTCPDPMSYRENNGV